MDWQLIINIGATTVLGVVAGFVSSVRKDIRESRDDLAAYKLKVAENYVTHQDLSDIKSMLHRIEDKLDLKKDKE